MKNKLCMLGMILFGISILLHTILTYMWAFSPYSLKMYDCMIRNIASCAGFYVCLKIYLDSQK